MISRVKMSVVVPQAIGISLCNNTSLDQNVTRSENRGKNNDNPFLNLTCNDKEFVQGLKNN